MTAKVVAFVRLSEVPMREAEGWVNTHDLVGTHHGRHATIMVWPKEEPPPNWQIAMEKPCA